MITNIINKMISWLDEDHISHLKIPDVNKNEIDIQYWYQNKGLWIFIGMTTFITLGLLYSDQLSASISSFIFQNVHLGDINPITPDANSEIMEETSYFTDSESTSNSSENTIKS